MERESLPKQVAWPRLVIDRAQAERNIQKMLRLAERSNARLRPHFKTHQSEEVARWFHQAGVTSCAVSNIAMVEQFATTGWQDILLALPANLAASDSYQVLAEQCKLGLIGDSVELVQQLDLALTKPVDFWVEIDAGYGRTGVRWSDFAAIEAMLTAVQVSQNLNLRGFLVHAGDSYDCRGVEEIRSFAASVRENLRHLKMRAEAQFPGLEMSYGDTPTCSVATELCEFDELRPGNFIYYDLTQVEIGSCHRDEIALHVLCPLIGIYPDRRNLVIHGGAVHLSKDRLDGGAFGEARTRDGELLGILSSLSQEHGTITLDASFDLTKLSLGDTVVVTPVHSCLAVDCLSRSTVSATIVL